MNREQLRALERERRRLESGRAADIHHTERLQRRNAAEAEAYARLERNGITAKDLKENFDKGFQEGVNQSTSLVVRASYAAGIIALRKTFRFGKKRLLRFLEEMDSQLQYRITNDELIDEAWELTGLRLVENDPFERIQEVKQ